jgi:hypothetical protein
VVERMYFFDPFNAGVQLFPAPAASSSSPSPAPPAEPLQATHADLSRSHEREVEQLIGDLALLAAKHQSRAKKTNRGQAENRKSPSAS